MCLPLEDCRVTKVPNRNLTLHVKLRFALDYSLLTGMRKLKYMYGITAAIVA